MTGVDTAARLTAAQAELLRREGVAFVGRYLVPETYAKALTADEAKDLRGAQLALLLVWETAAERMLGGAPAGAEDGARARRRAEALGVPPGTGICFAADFPASAGQLDALAAYLRAARGALGGYRCGVYGSFAVVEGMAKRGACELFWQCCAWSGGRVSPRAAVYQREWQGGPSARALAAKLGAAVDLDECADLAAAGLWLPPEPGAGERPAPAPWYAPAMAWAADNGILRDGRPEDFATRAEVAQMLFNLENRSEQA